jgi:hypothetical protein
LVLDFNIRYRYYYLEQINVVDHAIANDEDTVNAPKVVKPKMWIQVLSKAAEDWANQALIANPEFTQASIDVSISTNNPDRLDTTFKYKRTGTVRISSTTAEAGFNFGSL